MLPSEEYLDRLVGEEIVYYASPHSFKAPGILRKSDRPGYYDVEVPGKRFLSFFATDVAIEGKTITNIS